MEVSCRIKPSPHPSYFFISGSQITYPKLLSSPLPLLILFLSSAQLTCICQPGPHRDLTLQPWGWTTCSGPAALSLGAGGGHTAYIYRWRTVGGLNSVIQQEVGTFPLPTDFSEQKGSSWSCDCHKYRSMYIQLMACPNMSFFLVSMALWKTCPYQILSFSLWPL